MNKSELKELKRRAGKQVFTSRWNKFDAHGRAPCPFHGGNDGFTLWQRDGEWFATCRSGCNNKTWDVIGFVQDFDHLSFNEAVATLMGKPVTPAAPQKPKPQRMTEEQWNTWGRELTPADVQRFAQSRKDKTASFEAFCRLGCRVKGDVIGFPSRLTMFDPVSGSEVKYFTIKTRHLDSKDIKHEHCVDSNRFYNLDTVNPMEPVYTVEGEPDVAIMEDVGFRTVSLPNGSNGKFNKADLEILCEAEYIFLIGDQRKRGENDPGPGAIDALQAQLPPEKVSRIVLTDAHDVCQLASVYGDGFQRRIEELSADAVTPWVSKNVRSVSKLKSDEPEWVIERMIPYCGVTILCAQQGGQKTTFALHLARAVAMPISGNYEFLGRDVLPHHRRLVDTVQGSDWDTKLLIGRPDTPVLYIDRENPEIVIGNRLRKMGLIGCDNLLYWGDGDAHATPEVTDPRLEDWMRKERGLIIFDSLQDWYGDAKEIDNSAMVKLMHGFRRLARLGAGVLILHHTPANPLADKAWRGGTGIVAIPEMAVGMKRSETASEVLELREIRFRMCPTWEMDVRIEWEVEANVAWSKPDERWICMSLVRDEEGAALFAKREEEKSEKAAARAAAEKEKLEDLERAALGTAKTLQALAKETKISRNRIGKLLAERGVKSIDGKWVKKSNGLLALGGADGT